MRISEGKRSLLAAITSGFVGALALATSAYNVYLQRVQIRAQVWPHFTWAYSDAEGFSYSLDNAGVGPAIVKGVRVTVDGAPVRSWNEAFDRLRKSDPALDALLARSGSIHSTITSLVLGPGVTMHPLAFLDVKGEDKQPLERMQKKVNVQLCYCSTLDECWTTGGFESQPVAACPMESLTFRD
jgi:hypothetical protein